MPDSPRIDLRLIECLRVLVEESHVTRAAEKLDLSQPGMSNALARLRMMFRDEILVRTETGMNPTERGLELAELASVILSNVDDMMELKHEFDPMTDATTINFAASDYSSQMFLPDVLRRIGETAPNMTINVMEADPSKLRAQLETGQVDIALGIWTDLAANLYTTSVSREGLKCIARAAHPDIQGSLDWDQFNAAKHAYFGSSGGFVSTIESIIDQTLALRGIRRAVRLRSPDLTNIVDFVAKSDLIATVPASLAIRAAASHELQVLPPPFVLEEFGVSLIWHPRKHNNSAHKWLRTEIRSVMAR